MNYVYHSQNNRKIGQLDDGSGDSCLGMHTMGDNNDDDDDLLVTQRKGGAVNFWNPQNSTWILDKTIGTNYYGFSK